jgi:hypothetical protein
MAISGLSGEPDLGYFGIIFLALGLGFLTAAIVSMRLTRGDDVSTDAVSQP